VADLIVPRSRDHDLTKEAAVTDLFAATQPDVVVHAAAAIGGIGANRAQPGWYFYANAIMGVHVTEACRRFGVEKLVQIGTVCSYPRHTPVPFTEDALWDGYPEETNAAYGIAKRGLLAMAQGYRAQYGLNAIHLLLVNLYGPGDNFDLETSHVIPALMRKFVEAKEAGDDVVEVWGTGAASREFLYVDDAARGIVLATQHYDEPEPVNIGAGREVAIRELIELLVELTGFEGDIRWGQSKPDGQPRRMLDISCARTAFGFSATTDFEEGLRRTYQWWLGSRTLASARG
jgi:GDP-L-fucose synthase